MQLGITSQDIQQQTPRRGRLSHSPPPIHMALLISLHPQEQLPDLTAGQLKEPKGRKKTFNKTSCFLSELPWITTRPNKHQVQEDGSRWECTASTRSKNSNCIFKELSALEHLTEMAGLHFPLVEHRNLDTYLVLHSAWEFTTELLNQFSLYASAK